MGYLGPKGGYSELFAKKSDPSAELVPLSGLSQIFRSVANGSVDTAVVPIENSLDGLIGATVELLYKFKGRLHVVGSGRIEIEHALGALPGHAKLARIISRDTALNQCSDYLDMHYPDVRRIGTQSSAIGMEMIVREQLYDMAVISSKEGLKSYGLQVIAEKIANEPYNVTRFLVLGQGEGERGAQNTTAIGLRPQKDYPGFLLHVLKILCEQHGLNLSSIHSRPAGMHQYWFYLEIDGHASDSEVSAALSALAEELPGCELLLFGSFPVTDFTG